MALRSASDASRAPVSAHKAPIYFKEQPNIVINTCGSNILGYFYGSLRIDDVVCTFMETRTNVLRQLGKQIDLLTPLEVEILREKLRYPLEEDHGGGGGDGFEFIKSQIDILLANRQRNRPG